MALTHKLIEDWVKTTHGVFTYKTINREIEGSIDSMANLRVIMGRLIKDGLIERVGEQDGVFRLVETGTPIVDWQHANIENSLAIKFPFELEKYIRILPKAIIVLAGSKNAGKTTFCLNFIKLNMSEFPITYFCSGDMGAEMLNLRLRGFRDVKLEDWKFDARSRTGNYADIIKPNEINIIDFLTISDSFYAIAGTLEAIGNKLDKGIALICIQKDKRAELGRGGSFSEEIAQLYLTMDISILRIVAVKVWQNPLINPNGLKFAFKIINGAEFMGIKKLEEIL